MMSPKAFKESSLAGTEFLMPKSLVGDLKIKGMLSVLQRSGVVRSGC